MDYIGRRCSATRGMILDIQGVRFDFVSVVPRLTVIASFPGCVNGLVFVVVDDIVVVVWL